MIRQDRRVTTQEIQRLDRAAIGAVGIPSIVLMENAGRAVASIVLKQLHRRGRRTAKNTRQVSVFCGIGNNAGDGFVCARHLADAGVKTKIFLIGDPGDLKTDAAVNYRILKKMGCPVACISQSRIFFQKDIQQSDVIVDAIFGVGLNREIADPFKRMIDFINRAQKIVVAVDIPSGLDATSGKIYGAAIKASITVTFSAPKRGFFLREGPGLAGRIVVADIGIPKVVMKKVLSRA